MTRSKASTLLVAVSFATLALSGCSVEVVTSPAPRTEPPSQESAPELPPLDIREYLNLQPVESGIIGVGVTAGDAISIRRPDSAGGVDVEASLRPVKSKLINYIVLEVVPYNAVGDVVSSEIGGESRARLRYTGPIRGGEVDRGLWTDVWYNSTVEYVELVGVEIEFSDGTIEYFDLSANPVRGDQACARLESSPDIDYCRPLDPY